jgi:hypothetical protein
MLSHQSHIVTFFVVLSLYDMIHAKEKEFSFVLSLKCVWKRIFLNRDNVHGWPNDKKVAICDWCDSYFFHPYSIPLLNKHPGRRILNSDSIGSDTFSSSSYRNVSESLAPDSDRKLSGVGSDAFRWADPILGIFRKRRDPIDFRWLFIFELDIVCIIFVLFQSDKEERKTHNNAYLSWSYTGRLPSEKSVFWKTAI